MGGRALRVAMTDEVVLASYKRMLAFTANHCDTQAQQDLRRVSTLITTTDCFKYSRSCGSSPNTPLSVMLQMKMREVTTSIQLGFDLEK